MEGDVTQMTIVELERRISELVNSYAELLGSEQNYNTLWTVWYRLKELQTELEKRTNN